MDRVYKEDVPAAIEALEQLRAELTELTPRTDWIGLRIEPLLAHARALVAVMRSPRHARATTRLSRGVVMFRSDLIYLRDNLRSLRAIVAAEKAAHAPAGATATRPTRPRRRPAR